MPGLGDEVQAMKAGLMEIADLLVINKSDRAEADKMEMELQSVLSFFQPEDGWRPKIVRTIATGDSGIAQLQAAIDEHVRYLKSTGKYREQLLRQSRERLVDALEHRITSQIIGEGFEKFGISQRIEEICGRRVDPHTVVQELLQHLKME